MVQYNYVEFSFKKTIMSNSPLFKTYIALQNKLVNLRLRGCDSNDICM